VAAVTAATWPPQIAIKASQATVRISAFIGRSRRQRESD
jgi:hypothetical protein